jgi:hypothetical protein
MHAYPDGVTRALSRWICHTAAGAPAHYGFFFEVDAHRGKVLPVQQ